MAAARRRGAGRIDPDVEIELLADHPEAIPQLSEWFRREWAPYYGPGGPGNAAGDLSESSNRDVLPVALLAVMRGEVCGTAALKRESVTTHPDLTPWLAALLVSPRFRGRGIGARLVAAVEELASRLGFECIYAGTEAASDGGQDDSPLESLLVRRDWTFLERGPYFVSDVSIYRKTL